MSGNAKPRGRREGAYDALRRLIHRGDLAPGARVMEQEIAARLDVSRTPVREAFARLLQEGLLVHHSGDGRRSLAIAPLSTADLLDVYACMGALESAAALAIADVADAERTRIAHALETRQAAFEVEAAKTPLDLAALNLAHDAFHDAFFAPLAGPRLSALRDGVRPHADRYEWLYASLVAPQSFADTFAEHRAVLTAIAAGDAPAAAAAVRLNWSRAGRLLAATLSARLTPE